MTNDAFFEKNFKEPAIEKQWFYFIAKFNMPEEHMYDVIPDKNLLLNLKNRGADLFTFIQRDFLGNSLGLEKSLFSGLEPVGLLKIRSYDKWFSSITHNARWQTKKGLRMGLKTKIVEINEIFINSAFKIYNETPIRQGGSIQVTV